MQYSSTCGEKISRLAFGTMRLPLRDDGSIDQKQVNKMTDYAMEHGVNYYDTAYPYHEGKSEIAIGKALAKYPRESFKLATKFPGHQFMKKYDCDGIFNEQLAKCGVDHFDFYLLHNIYENSFSTYKNSDYGIVDYFVKQKELGRIKHLGFSTHVRTENLEEVLDFLGDRIEFCQIQLNYVDWTLQDAKRKIEILGSRGIPVMVMEPLRGGKLTDLGKENNARLKAARADESIASWSFRWLMRIPEVATVLSGMSSLEQMEDNIKTFSEGSALREEEWNMMLDIADTLKKGVPCTACGYCCSGCPMGLDIPMLLAGYNDMKFASAMTVKMQMDGTPAEKWPDKCIGCGACASVCPQHIDIPEVLNEYNEMLRTGPTWAEMCRQREEAAEKMRKHNQR
ncbi:MAG: aldo/keto reductase [Lachnospiraceae bacterium]|nr:aldo/keto reductase [Lachnospiraceae bacterium]